MGGRGKARASAAAGRRGSGWKGAGGWIVGAVLILAALVIPAMDLGAASHHPEPREHVDHSHVVPAERYAAYPRVATVYGQVAEIPHVIDGLYCYCACSEHSGHYSLLDCFRDDHGARCDVCLSEAAMAHRMHTAGEPMEAIRDAIDRLYDA